MLLISGLGSLIATGIGGQYKQALAAEKQDLAIRQKLDDQSGIASAYFQLAESIKPGVNTKRRSHTMSRAVTVINSSAKKLMLLTSGLGSLVATGTGASMNRP
jgi:hypothetical protein